MPRHHVLAGANVILDVSLNAVEFAAQFAPVPALAPVLGVVQGILTACGQVHSNKKEVLQLQERCQYLVFALGEQSTSKGVPETRISQIVDGCVVHLNEVLLVVGRFANYKRWQSFIQLQEISDGLRKCHMKIDDCCREFQIRSHMQLHQWQGAFEVAAREDHAELVTLLTDLKTESSRTQQMVADLGDNVVTLLQRYQEQLRKSEQDSAQYHALEHGLYQIQKKSGELPPDTDLKAGEARRIGKFPVAGNAAFDIWEGTWLGQEKVALKTVRGVHVSPETRKRFQREVEVWRRVWLLDRGRYILPFYGACFEDGPYPYMVSPWMQNGDVMQYLARYPTVDRMQIVRGIAQGLSLLHNLKPMPIAHGDVKANVLIDDQGQPLLADFGLSKILEDVTGVPFTQSKGVSESYRWFAPELCSHPGVISMQSDVFAYAMTVVEIMTGQPPFAHIRRTTEVLIEMQKGERPKKPSDDVIRKRGLDERLWDILTQCWKEEPADRPTIDQVLAQL